MQCKDAGLSCNVIRLFYKQFSCSFGDLFYGRSLFAGGGICAERSHSGRRRICTGNCAAAISVLASGAQIVAIFPQTVYNKNCNGGHGVPDPDVGTAVVLFFIRLCGDGQRIEHDGIFLPRPPIFVLSDGHHALAGCARGGFGSDRQRERCRNAVALLRRGAVFGDERTFGGSVYFVYHDLFALCFCNCGDGARSGLETCGGICRGTDAVRIFNFLHRVCIAACGCAGGDGLVRAVAGGRFDTDFDRVYTS